MQELNDFLIINISFELRTGEEVAFRPVAMYDYAWVKQNIGKEINEILTTSLDEPSALDNVFRVFFQQIPVEDRPKYKAIKRISVDENGEEFEEVVGGYRLFKEKIGHEWEIVKDAYLMALRAGQAEPEKDDGKKKVKMSPTMQN